jgi:hypothetical protein
MPRAEAPAAPQAQPAGPADPSHPPEPAQPGRPADAIVTVADAPAPQAPWPPEPAKPGQTDVPARLVEYAPGGTRRAGFAEADLPGVIRWDVVREGRSLARVSLVHSGFVIAPQARRTSPVGLARPAIHLRSGLCVHARSGRTAPVSSFVLA